MAYNILPLTATKFTHKKSLFLRGFVHSFYIRAAFSHLFRVNDKALIFIIIRVLKKSKKKKSGKKESLICFFLFFQFLIPEVVTSEKQKKLIRQLHDNWSISVNNKLAWVCEANRLEWEISTKNAISFFFHLYCYLFFVSWFGRGDIVNDDLMFL